MRCEAYTIGLSLRFNEWASRAWIVQGAQTSRLLDRQDDPPRLLVDLPHLLHGAAQSAVVGDPFLVAGSLGVAEPQGDGPSGNLGGPLPVGAMQAGRHSAAAAARLVAVREPLAEAALRDEPDLSEGSGESAVAALELGEDGRRIVVPSLGTLYARIKDACARRQQTTAGGSTSAPG